MSDIVIDANQGNSFTPQLTEAEQAYFSSRGAKADGLTSPSESTGGGNEGLERSPPPTASPEAPTAQAAPSDDENDPTVYIDEEGRARSTNTGKYVPHAALHRERERRKAVEVEKTQLADKYARIEERLSILNEVMGAQEGPLSPKQTGQAAARPVSVLEEAPIDPAIDVFGAIEQIKRQQQAMLAQQQQAQQQYSNDTTYKAVTEAYTKDAHRFMAIQPDFTDAYEHLKASVDMELKFMGLNEAERLQKLGETELFYATKALHNRQSPAEAMYEFAKSRGYVPKTAAPAAAAPTQNAAATIDKIAKAQKANVTLTNTGSSSGEPLTAPMLADMSDEEFAATAAKLGKQNLRRLMGG